MNLVERVNVLAKILPREETYALSDQLRRAVVSIPSNIAEGQNRNTNNEYIQFLYIALGSISEVETQLLIGQRLKYFNNIDNDLDSFIKIGKMLNALIN